MYEVSAGLCKRRPSTLDYMAAVRHMHLYQQGSRLSKEHALMSTEFVTTSDGVRIAYDAMGEGPALMLLHGAGKTRNDWHKVGYVGRLVEDYKVITVDIRGSGESDCLTQTDDYAIEKICRDLEEVADACGVGQVGVWGYSFGGNIARYLGAWSNRVKAIAVIGVPFGEAVHEEFDRYIDEFVEKYGPLTEAYNKGGLNEKRRKTAIKGRIPVWVACFQAMRGWPSIGASDIECAKLLLTGTKNRSVMRWLEKNGESLDRAGVRVEIVEGLTHQQEFSQIDRVYPAVRSFFGDVWTAKQFF
jgi:pimeloyl-ACP methyl ester carboxylesterase